MHFLTTDVNLKTISDRNYVFSKTVKHIFIFQIWLDLVVVLESEQEVQKQLPKIWNWWDNIESDDDEQDHG